MTAPAFEIGDCVVRLHPLEGHDWYETVVADVDLLREPDGTDLWLYRLTCEDGSRSSIRVEADEIRAVEVDTNAGG